MPTVSVIIPTYNRAPELQRAMDSVLAQSHEDLELVVVDDASTDDTPAVVRGYDDDRVRYVAHEKNRGAPAARNTGLDHAEGEYVAFLDSDDEWHPEKLARQLGRLTALDETYVAVYCDTERAHPGVSGRVKVALAGWLHDDRRRTEGGEELVGDVICDDLHTGAGSTLLVERAVAERIGGFDESFDRFQDPEFLIRVLREGRLAHVPHPLVVRHETGAPDADTLEAAVGHYREAFDETVAALETEGRDVVGRHALVLAKAHLRDGNVVEGGRHLCRADVAPRQYPGLVWDGASGLRTRGSVAAVGVAAVLLLVAVLVLRV